MSGIYIHIPFCKQACHYCDFHFSTSLKKKDELLFAIQKELKLRKDELDQERVETIYFGGGTPSLLKIGEIEGIINTIYSEFTIGEDLEITLEANPDDLSRNRIKQLSISPVNRLSIGIQSFFEDDLQMMNRAHNAREATESLVMAQDFFENISIDLIYGIPNEGDDRWQKNLDQFLTYKLPHLSAYALTVEPNTALHHQIRKGEVNDVDDEQARQEFNYLCETMSEQGFVNYEISNFGRPGYFSKNNTAYWQEKKYLGIGPSAHSFDGQKRGWNVRNNTKYIQALWSDILPIEFEHLSLTDRYNEYVMTGLRTIWGISLKRVKEKFGSTFEEYLKTQAEKHIIQGLLRWQEDRLLATKKGKFLVDGIASDLFIINLK